MIYFAQAEGSTLIKIGTSTSVRMRLSGLAASLKKSVVLLAAEHGDRDRERELHQRFASLRDHGEWFHPGAELLGHISSLPSVELNDQAKKKTLLVDDEIEALVEQEAKRAGLAWATMLKLLAREAIAARGPR